MKKIKIIYFIHSTFYRGGAAKSFYEAQKNLQKNPNLDINIFLLDIANEELIEKLKDLNVKIFFIKSKNFLVLGKYLIGWLRGFNFFKTFLLLIRDITISFYNLNKLNKKISSINPDIVHLNSSVFIPLAFLMKKKYKLIIHVRESLISCGKIKKIFLRKFLKKVDGLICISKMEKQDFQGLLDSGKILEVISNPINPEITNKDLFLNDLNGISIGCLAGHDEKKGGLLFLESINLLKGNHNIFFAGSEENNSVYSNNIKKQIKIARESENINLFYDELIEDVNSFIKKCDLIVVPHTRPHFSRVIIEAFAHKKPVISFSDPWTKSLNKESGEVIFLVQNKNKLELLNKINFVLENKKLIDERVEIGFSYWKKRHEPNKVSQELLNLYLSII